MLAPVTPYDRLEELEAENALLRDRIAKLSGADRIEKARLTFGLTDSEAIIFCLMQRRGLATQDMILDAIYDERRIDRIDRPDEAVRSHIKRIRQKTRPYGIDFHTIYSLGFEMDEVTRARVGRMLK